MNDVGPIAETEGSGRVASTHLRETPPIHADLAGRLRGLPWGTIAPVLAYAVIALAANWPNWPGDPSRTRTVQNFGVIGSTDVIQATSFLAWTAHAVVHGLNPFYTSAINYPYGANLVQNTASPLLGLLVAPLTLLVSPLASMNLLLWLALVLSASSMFFVLRRFVSWRPAAFVGGALYGFSPWVIDQNLYHLNLCFVPLPPVILLSAYELLRPRQDRPLRWGVALGVGVAAQFFISTEICALTIITAVIGAVILSIDAPTEVIPAVRRARWGVVAAVGIGVAVLTYPIYIMFAGPYHFIGTPSPGGEGADLLSPLLPTSLQLLTLGHLGVIGSGLVHANTSENGGYLGAPLLVLMVVFLVAYRRRPWLRFCALMVLVTFILSLGNELDVDGHATGFTLPFHLVDSRFIFDNILQVRFGLFVALFAAALVALGVDQMHANAQVHRREDHGGSSVRVYSVRGLSARWPVYALGILSLVTLAPRFPLPTAAAGVPAYFSSGAVDRIPAGSVVLISPYPSIFDPMPQLWQAVAQDRFRIIGGYASFSSESPSGATSGNYPSPYPPSLNPIDVEMFLTGEADGTPFLSGTIPPVDVNLECDFRQFLRNYHVGTLVVGPIPTSFSSHRVALDDLFSQALGPPSAVDGRITVWYDLASTLSQPMSRLSCVSG